MGAETYYKVKCVELHKVQATYLVKAVTGSEAEDKFLNGGLCERCQCDEELLEILDTNVIDVEPE